MQLTDQKFIAAIGPGRNEFFKKIATLKAQWQARHEISETRIIAPLLFHEELLSELDVALMADNLEYFQQHYDENYQNNYKYALNLACLFGSKDIAEYLIEKFSIAILDKEHEFIFIAAALSINSAWVEDLANLYTSNKKPIPAYIFSFADKEMLEIISTIFKASLNSSILSRH